MEETLTNSNRKRMRRFRTINRVRVFSFCLFVGLFSLAIHGCGGTFLEYNNQGDVSGTWSLTLTQPGVPSVRATQLYIRQDKRYDPFSGTTADNATFTGTFNGRNDIIITLTNADKSTTTLTGTVSNSWNTLSGTYASTGSDGSGTWTSDRNVPPPTPALLSASPSSATLSCSTLQSQQFTVTGGTRASYSVTATTNGNLVTLTTADLTTTGIFTVSANACSAASGTVVSLTVSDNSSTPVTVLVTISNP